MYTTRLYTRPVYLLLCSYFGIEWPWAYCQGHEDSVMHNANPY